MSTLPVHSKSFAGNLPDKYSISGGFGLETSDLKSRLLTDSLISQQYNERNETFFIRSTMIGGSHRDKVKRFETDKYGNYYVLGITESNDLQIVNGDDNTYNGETDLFLMKLNPNFELIWSTYLGGNSSEFNSMHVSTIAATMDMGLVIDENDNVIVAGNTKSLDFPTSPSYPESLRGNYDIFVSKFYSNGTKQWSRLIGDTGLENVNDVKVDSQNNIILTGWTTSNNFNASFYNLDNTGWTNDSIWHNNVLVIKLNAAGQEIWSHIIGGEGFEIANSVGIDQEGNILLAGHTGSNRFPQLLFDTPNYARQNEPNEGITGQATDIFLAKIRPSGELVWSRLFGGTGLDKAHHINIGENNEIIIVGATHTDLDNPQSLLGYLHGYVAIFDEDGNNAYTHQFQTAQSDIEYSSLDGRGNIIVSGELVFREKDANKVGEIDFNSSYLYPEKEYFSLSTGEWRLRNLIIAKFSISLLQILWYTIIAISIGETIYEFHNDISMISIKDNGNIVLCGQKNNWQDPIHNLPELSVIGTTTKGRTSGFISEIPDPLSDYDNDYMSNVYEFQHNLNLKDSGDAQIDHDSDGITTLKEYFEGLDPWSSDTDADLMDDKWELEMGTDPTLNDSFSDFDGDFLTNYQEYQLSIQGFNFDPLDDTDGLDDYDGDGIPNYWEFNYYQNIDDPTDVNGDFDNDGLSNIREYELGTNPALKDTDGDGDSDKKEVDNGSDPLDSDSQVFIERRFIPLIVVLVIIGLIVITVYFSKRRSKKRQIAITSGFSSYKEYVNARKAGFSSSQEQDESLNHGFLALSAKLILSKYKISTGKDLKIKYSNCTDNFGTNRLLFHQFYSNELNNKINKAQTPLELEDRITDITIFKEEHRSIINEITELKDVFNELSLLVQTLQTRILLEYTNSAISENYKKLNEIFDEFDGLQNRFDTLIQARIEWFNPWPRLLNFLSIVEMNKSVDLEYIATTIDSNPEIIEKFLINLLTVDPNLGVYDDNSRSFIRKYDTEQQIQLYIDQAIRILEGH
ncbi:MAG: SBBP repeat-containing protein [Candidatus Kariarchaeaceae archaeon]|jgi:hypothetical protein